MSERIKTQVLVVGGGPGGHVAAIRAGQLGLDTVLVEAGRLGGTCLTRGCIPSKALIHAAEAFHMVRRAEAKGGHMGITVGRAQLDFARTVQWKDAIVDRLSDGVAGLLRRAKVRVLPGWAEFRDAKTCTVEARDGVATVVEAEHVILATGSEAVALPGLPWGPQVISSTEALSLDAVPRRLAIVGAGYIGLELGMALRRLGAEVIVVEAEDRILPQYDAALTAPVAKALLREGLDVRLSTTVEGHADGKLTCRGSGEPPFAFEADKVLVTVGRRPLTEGWGREAMAVDLEGRFIKVDDQCRTSVRNVWAIGDAVGEPMLAHKASAQGAMVAEVIAGHRRRFDPVAIPAVCFTDPEIVVVGLARPTQDVVSTTFPLAANGRALTLGEDQGGFVRVLSDPDDHRLLGLAAVGRGVSELSGEMVALLEMGALLEDLEGIIHAHPTQSEALHEAGLRALGRAVHL